MCCITVLALFIAVIGIVVGGIAGIIVTFALLFFIINLIRYADCNKENLMTALFIYYVMHLLLCYKMTLDKR